MRYPGGDPENGPAYRQRWSGTRWECVEHKPICDQPDEDPYCVRCGEYIRSQS